MGPALPEQVRVRERGHLRPAVGAVRVRGRLAGRGVRAALRAALLRRRVRRALPLRQRRHLPPRLRSLQLRTGLHGRIVWRTMSNTRRGVSADVSVSK